MRKTALWLFLGVVLIGGCDSAANPKNVRDLDTSSIAGIVNYGNHVYYFTSKGANFGNALSKFIGENPNMELVAITDEGTGMYGAATGHFVVFRVVSR
jgi:hypothetical protein